MENKSSTAGGAGEGAHKRLILLARITSLLSAAREGGLDVTAYEVLDLAPMSAAELAVVARAIHEIVYAPPRRS